jgi:hypothetical protein
VNTLIRDRVKIKKINDMCAGRKGRPQYLAAQSRDANVIVEIPTMQK